MAKKPMKAKAYERSAADMKADAKAMKAMKSKKGKRC